MGEIIENENIMDLVRTLNSVGKFIFVKYYYNFRDKSRDECIIESEKDNVC